VSNTEHASNAEPASNVEPVSHAQPEFNDARKAGSGENPGSAREQVVIKDKRKIDANGQPRTDGGQPPTEPSATGGAGSAPEPAEPTVEVVQGELVEPSAESTDTTAAPPQALGAELEALRTELDERLRDVQRIGAEYANYRKRVERDRAAVSEQATGMVISSLLPILDDIDRAREHDDLVGPFATVAEQLTAALAKFGLTGFGEVGDAFDPTRHEAVAHQTSAEVTEPTCVTVMRRGYLLGDRLLRAALVAVADPE
jgi:molecular chaperone GrpE